MKSVDVLLLTQDKKTVAAVRAVLESNSVRGKATVCTSMPELRARLLKPTKDVPYAVVVADIDQEPQEILFELSKVVAASAKTRFIVVSKSFDEKLVLQAMPGPGLHGLEHQLRRKAGAPGHAGRGQAFPSEGGNCQRLGQGA